MDHDPCRTPLLVYLAQITVSMRPATVRSTETDLRILDGVNGTVEEVTLRPTRLRTLEGEVVIISNGDTRQLANMSVDWARLLIDVPVLSVAATSIESSRSCVSNALRFVATASWPRCFLEGPDMWGDPCRLDVPSTRTVGAQCAVRRFDRQLRRRARWRWPSALATRRVRLERWWSDTHPVATGSWLAR